jgi:hypothetical protein
VPPAPQDDVYDGVGNTLLDVSAPLKIGVNVAPPVGPTVHVEGRVLDNDTDGDGPSALFVTGVGNVTPGADVVMNPDGSFTYMPPVGFGGLSEPFDTFTYTVSDGETTTDATVTINLADVVWYVDNGVGPGGTGRSDAPLDGLAPLSLDTVPDDAGDIIFVYAGIGPYDGIVLEPAQQLLGQGGDLVVGPHTLVSASVRPLLAGNGVQLAVDATVRDLDVAASITGNPVGALTIGNVAVDAPSGPAVSLENGELDVVLDRVSANAPPEELRIAGVAPGGTNGIRLVDTTGSFTVTGDGSPGSGGAIDAMTGDGVSLTNVTNVSLADMTITNNGGNGIGGDGVSGFSLTGSVVNDNGDAVGEAGIRFDQLTGTAAITGTTISGSWEDNLRVTAASGTLTLTISGSTIAANQPGTGGNGVTVIGSGTADVTLTVNAGTQLNGNQARGLLTTFTGSAKQDVTVTGAVLMANTVAIDLGADAASMLTFDVSANATIADQTMNAVQVFSASTCAGCVVSGTIAGNTIGTAAAQSGSVLGQGIVVDLRGNTVGAVAVTGNTVLHTDKEGIALQTRLGSASVGFTLTGNSVGTPDDDELPGFPVEPPGILVQARNTSTLCLDIATNQSSGAGSGAGYRVRQVDAGATFNLAGFGGDGTSTSEVATFVVGRNTSGTASATRATTFTGVASGACAAP